MQRRKLLTAMGSLAAGGAAAMGTGAFTSVEADRSVSVEVAGDKQAYLGIQAVNSSPNSAYVEKSDGTVSLDFSGTDGDGSSLSSGADGFNSNATTQIDDLLAVKNQGTQEVGFYVDITGAGAGEDFVTIIATDTRGAGSDELSSNVAYDGGDNDTTVDPVALSTGQQIFLHLVADTASQSPNSFNGTVTFVADDASSDQNSITS
jgi:hypothetical protein